MLLAQALMPDASLTQYLVSHSAQMRIDDFHALARLIDLWPAQAQHHAAWRAADEFVQQLPGHAQNAIGASPLFRRWLHALGRSLIESAPRSLQDDLLSQVNNYTMGLQSSVMLQARHGVIETWDCRAALRLPSSGHDGTWLCHRQGLEVELSRAHSGLQLTLNTSQRCLPDSEIVIRNDLPGLRVALNENEVPERERAVRAHEADARLEAYPDGEFPLISQAAADLARAWPAGYADWQHTMRVVVPRLPPKGWRMEGFSLSSMQGAVWVHPGAYMTVLESLVHEQGHIKLRYIEDWVPLLAPGQSPQRYAVGWRSDARPIIGIFEGVYVHLHCAMAWERVLHAGLLEASLRPAAQERDASLRAQARDGLALLRRHARFTLAGQGFVSWAEAVLAQKT